MYFKYILIIGLIFYSVFTENISNKNNSDPKSTEKICQNSYRGMCFDKTTPSNDNSEPKSTTKICHRGMCFDQTTTTPNENSDNEILNNWFCWWGICVWKTTPKPTSFEHKTSPTKDVSTVTSTTTTTPTLNRDQKSIPHDCNAIRNNYHQLAHNKCCQYFPKIFNECVYWCNFFNQSLEVISFSTETVLPTPITYPVQWPTVSDPISWSTVTEPTEEYFSEERQNTMNSEPSIESTEEETNRCNETLNVSHQMAYNMCCHSYRKHMNRCVFWCKFLNQSLEEISVNYLGIERHILAPNPVPWPTVADQYSWSTISYQTLLSTKTDTNMSSSQALNSNITTFA